MGKKKLTLHLSPVFSLKTLSGHCPLLLTGARFESWGVHWTSRWRKTARCYRWHEAKESQTEERCISITCIWLWISQHTHTHMVYWLPAWSTSPGVFHGRCPLADDSSESPTQTSDSPGTCSNRNNHKPMWSVCWQCELHFLVRSFVFCFLHKSL